MDAEERMAEAEPEIQWVTTGSDDDGHTAYMGVARCWRVAMRLIKTEEVYHATGLQRVRAWERDLLLTWYIQLGISLNDGWTDSLDDEEDVTYLPVQYSGIGLKAYPAREYARRELVRLTRLNSLVRPTFIERHK